MAIERNAAAAIRALVTGISLAASAGCGAAVEQGPVSGGDPSGLVGNPAPDFHVKAVVGSKEPVALKELRGQVILLDFWGTFCAPCKKSFPKLQGLSAKYGPSGLRIIGVSEDEAEDKDKIPAFAAEYGAKFTLAWDDGKTVAQQYKPDTMPTSFLIDRKGLIRYTHVGFHDGDEKQIEKEIQELLAP